MNIGLDISPLQSPHRFRGIGSVIINFINNISNEDKKNYTFTFYMHDQKEPPFDDPLKLLDLSGVEYEVVLSKSISYNIRFNNKFGKVIGKFKSLWSESFNDNRIKTMGDIDVFVQFDQLRILPRKNGNIKNIIVFYDIIPYVLEHDYLWSYRTARHRGRTRKNAIKCSLNRWLYAHRNRINSKRADRIIAISEHSKNDLLKISKINPDKVEVVSLGQSVNKIGSSSEVTLSRFYPSVWGYIPKPFKLDDTPFILFVGGADERRKLDHLVTAFNHIRAQGYELKLILAGDTMQGPKNIPTLNIQHALQNSSYIDDIIFLGFVSENTRDYLYSKALAFIYPSMYEGFGLPVLEAMRYGTPVITYKNSSIPEVGKNAVIYADGYKSILSAVKDLLSKPSSKEHYGNLAKKRASTFSWKNFSYNVFKVISAK